jgi:acyl-CoA thioesterase FadM
MLRPGDDTVTIQTQVCPRRNGAMVLDCYQTALVKGEHVIAQGKVTIMALNRETWRPTKKLPDWFLQKFEASD